MLASWFMSRPLVWAAVVVIPIVACGGAYDNPRSGAGGDGGLAGDGGASACVGTGPIRLATAREPDAIALDSANVFWIDSADGTVNVVPKCGGAAQTLVMTATLGSSTLIPAGIAVAGGEVYFTTQDPWNPDGNDGAVWRVPVAGGTPSMLEDGLDRPGPIAVRGTSMFWIESWETPADDGQIVQAPLDGGDTTILASAQNGPWSLALGETTVVWTTSGSFDSEGGTIFETAAGGGAIVDGIAVAQPMPVGVAVQGTNIYWVDRGDPNVNNSGRVMTIPLDPKAAANPVTLASGGVPQAIAVDSSHVYWTDSQSQSVQVVPLAGGTATTLAAKQVAPVAIAVDDTNVYWATIAEGTGQGSIMKAPK